MLLALDARAGSLWHKRAGATNSSDLTSTSRWTTLIYSFHATLYCVLLFYNEGLNNSVVCDLLVCVTSVFALYRITQMFKSVMKQNYSNIRYIIEHQNIKNVLAEHPKNINVFCHYL